MASTDTCTIPTIADSIALLQHMIQDTSTDHHCSDVMLLQTRIRAANTIAIHWLELNERRYKIWLKETNDDLKYHSYIHHTSPTINGLIDDTYRIQDPWSAQSRNRRWYMYMRKRHCSTRIPTMSIEEYMLICYPSN
jgi:hypothetical protein